MKDVTLDNVKALRARTLISIKECKEALVLSGGDLDEAEKLLKKNGRLKANARSRRKTESGGVFSSLAEDRGVLIKLTCESDSVAMNRIFKETGKALADRVRQNGNEKITAEMLAMVKDIMAVFKENIDISEVFLMDIGSDERGEYYIHNDGQIGVIVKVRRRDQSARYVSDELLADLALHVCAASPIFLDRDSIDPLYIEEQGESLRNEVSRIDSNDENLKERILRGKLEKLLSSQCLMEQEFVKDRKMTISQFLSENPKGKGDLTVTGFLRMEV